MDLKFTGPYFAICKAHLEGSQHVFFRTKIHRCLAFVTYFVPCLEGSIDLSLSVANNFRGKGLI